MSARYTRPKWWQLYLTFPLLIGLFALDTRLNLSQRLHTMLQVGILLCVYGLVQLWLKANQAALSDYRQYRGRVTVINLRPCKLAELQDEQRSMLRLSDSETKGTSSDTYEADYVYAEFFPVEEIPQEMKKE